LSNDKLVCGVDEAGRGPLAGDVYAAAVILPEKYELPLLNDSKQLTAKRREKLFEDIKEQAVAYCIATASVEEIEQLNIRGAALLAMRRAIEGLNPSAAFALIDGNTTEGIPIPARAIVGGDSTEPSISAASILAKVARDRYMLELAEKYPEYGFERHKGYGTKLHYERLAEFGASPVHRKSFLKSSGGKWEVKKTTAQETGDWGEQIGCDVLVSKGFEVIARNWHSRYGEIDIIAKNDIYIVFAEVKTRKNANHGTAAEFVDESKQEKLRATAELYLQEFETELQPRFDVIEVYPAEPKPLVRHIQNAF